MGEDDVEDGTFGAPGEALPDDTLYVAPAIDYPPIEDQGTDGDGGDPDEDLGEEEGSPTQACGDVHKMVKPCAYRWESVPTGENILDKAPLIFGGNARPSRYNRKTSSWSEPSFDQYSSKELDQGLWTWCVPEGNIFTPHLLSHPQFPNWAYCTLDAVWYCIKGGGAIARHFWPDHAPQPWFQPSVGEARAHILLFFLTESISVRKIENEDLQAAFNLGKVMKTRKSLQRRIDELHPEVAAALKAHFLTLEHRQLQWDATSDATNRRIFAYVGSGVNRATAEMEEFVLKLFVPIETNITSEVIARYTLAVIGEFGPFEGFTTDDANDENCAFNKILVELMPALVGLRFSCVIHGLALACRAFIEAEPGTIGEVNKLRATFTHSLSFTSMCRQRTAEFVERRRDFLTRELELNPGADRMTGQLTSNPARVTAEYKRALVEEHIRVCEETKELLDHQLSQRLIDVEEYGVAIAELKDAELLREICRRQMLTRAGDTRWVTQGNTIKAFVVLEPELLEFQGRKLMTSDQNRMYTAELRENVKRLDVFFNAWTTAQTMLEGNDFANFAHVPVALYCAQKALRDAEKDFPAGAAAGLAKLDQWRSEHAETILAGNRATFFAYWMNPADIIGLPAWATVEREVEREVETAFRCAERKRRVMMQQDARVPPTQARVALPGFKTSPIAVPDQKAPCYLSGLEQCRAYREESVPLTLDTIKPLPYWLSKRDEWPELADLALRYLARVCCSASAERCFSRVKWLEGLRRLRLTDKHLCEMSLMACNAAITRSVAMSTRFIAAHLSG
jgi:hypothetical protein